MGKASDTGGVKPMSITGRFQSERERLLGMTDAERAFRKQWLKDQELSANEPRVVPEIYKATYNPIRRFYRWPLDKLGDFLAPRIGAENAALTRYMAGKAILFIGFAYATTYYFKYNQNDWTSRSGWRVVQSRVAVYEGDPGYPKVSDRSKGEDYASRGFKNVTLDL